MIAAWLLACTPEGAIGPLAPSLDDPAPAPPGLTAASSSSPRPHVSVEVVSAGADPVVTTTGVPDAPSGTDLSAELFSDDVVNEFDVWLPNDSIQALRRDPYTYVEGAFEYRGVRYQPVGVRCKGQNSFRPIDDKPSLKIKLDAYVPGLDLLGLEEITLNNMSDDESMMHDRVAYWMYRQQGVTAARASHAVVRINGESRGLYSHVETVDEELLEHWYEDPTGSMWELWDTDFRDEWIPAFEHEEGVDDRTALYATANALEQHDPRRRWRAVSVFVDASKFLDYTAVSAIVGQFDSYPWRSPGDDCHVYQNATTGLLEFLPHGVDESFSDPSYDFTDGGGLLLDACTDDRACTQDYEDRLWAVQIHAEEVGLLDYARQVRDQIEPYAEEDEFRPYSMNDVRGEQQDMLDFIRNRPYRLEDLVGPRP